MQSLCSSPGWSENYGSSAESSGFHYVSRAALADSRIPEDIERLLLLFADIVYRPVVEAVPDRRWQVLQEILTGPWKTALSGVPRSAEIGERETSGDPIESLARSLADLFDESEPESKILERGADYLRRRTRLLHRRGSSLAGDCVAMSFTASQGFVWALLFIALSGFYAQHSTLEFDDVYDFVVLVLSRGGEDQYRLLRIAENELIDREEEEHLVHEGELSLRDEQMERDTHEAWLELRDPSVA